MEGARWLGSRASCDASIRQFTIRKQCRDRVHEPITPVLSPIQVDKVRSVGKG